MKPIRAKTHPPEYRLHKYWSRKPHNVIRDVMARYIDAGSKVLDPFCGSGVALLEAARIGSDATGVDVNPAAINICRLYAETPTLSDYDRAVHETLRALRSEIAPLFRDQQTGQPIRFVEHSMVVACPKCGEDNSGIADSQRICSTCRARLSYSLRAMTGSIVTGYMLDDGSWISSPDRLKDQEEKSGLRGAPSDVGSSFHPFTENRRTLTSNSHTAAEYFTPRNLNALLTGFKEISKSSDRPVKNALFVAMTSAVAQCSRLIASRGRLTSGGPAWTIPGYWVPRVHLEANPLLRIESRLKAVRAAIAAIGNRPPKGRIDVIKGDAESVTRDLESQGRRFDFAFLDPPYGDSVPYLEFSQLWNSFLGEQPDPSLDVSVSDREQKEDPWVQYERRLARIMERVVNVLKPDGKILLTFNNNDQRAWTALLKAFQAQGLRCCDVAFQYPAVVSTKAQMAPDGSYVGDFYAVFERGYADVIYREDLSPVRQYMNCAVAARSGNIRNGVARRAIMFSALLNNIKAESIRLAFDELLGTDWEVEFGAGNNTKSSRQKTLKQIVFEQLSTANFKVSDMKQFTLDVAMECEAIGYPDTIEVAEILRELRSERDEKREQLPLM